MKKRKKKLGCSQCLMVDTCVGKGEKCNDFIKRPVVKKYTPAQRRALEKTR